MQTIWSKLVEQKNLIDCIWGAKAYQPDGIVNGSETWSLVIADDVKSTATYPYQGLNNKLKGLRLGEIVTITAGSGTGKSQVCREIAYHLNKSNEKLGFIALEENVQRSIRGIYFLSLLTNQYIYKK